MIPKNKIEVSKKELEEFSKKEYEENKVDTQLDMAISQVKKLAK